VETSHGFGNGGIGEEQYFETSTIPPGKKLVGCKWVYTLKYRAD